MRLFRFVSLCVLGLPACSKPNPVSEKKPMAAVHPEPPEVDATRLVGAAKDESNWLTHGRTYGEQRFSPLVQINGANVAQLSLAWSLDLDTHRGQEATPLVVDGTMYSTSAWSKVQAIDAVTGALLWQYDPAVPGETGVKACCDVVNRGVAFWKGRIFVGTLDGRLVALDAKSGKVVWSVVTVDQTKAYTITGAPRVVKGKVIIGNGGAEFGVRGYVSAYDADSGKLVWRFFTVPGDPAAPPEAPIMKTAAATWSGQWWKLGGGGTVWDSMAYDPELDLLYVGTGNGSPWNPSKRTATPGDNLFLSSIIALRPDTGEYVWHFQTTPGEGWDYTATQHIVLAELMIDGKPRKVLMQAPKNGFFYVIDRTNGEFISARPFAQENWATGVDPKTGRPIVNPNALYGSTGKPWIAMPGPLGAHNWQPMSFDPATGFVYIPAQEVPFAYATAKDYEPKPLGFNVGLDGMVSSMPQAPAIKAQVLASVRGFLVAWDPVQQKEVFRVEEPGPWNGGVLTTAGGLVFEGNAAGFFNAYDAHAGTRLWQFPAQTGIMAAPITYSVDGKQYVAVVAGWGGAFALSAGEVAHKGSLSVNRSRVLAFRLGGDAKLPEATPPPENVATPPLRFGTAATIGQGFALYERYCTVCHGDAVVSGGLLPDLRWSPAAFSLATWVPIVLGGSRRDKGMVSFAKVLSAAEVDAIRAYVVGRANDSQPTPKP